MESEVTEKKGTKVCEVEMNEFVTNKMMSINEFMKNRKLSIEMQWIFESVTESRGMEIKDDVAIIPIHGVLVKSRERFADFEQTSYEEIESDISLVVDNPEIRTIVLDFNSPGGDVNGLFETCDFLLECGKKKRCIAFVNDSAFSAAYALASCCDEIVGTDTGGVGSVGVICQHVDYSKAEEKAGIKVTSIYAGKHKNDLSPHEPISDEATADLQAEVNRLYEKFVQLVAKNRGMSEEAVKNTEAKTFFGENSKKSGFLDNITNSKALFNHLMGGKMDEKVKVAAEVSDAPVCAEKVQPDFEAELSQYKEQILAITKLCRIAKSNRLAEFLEAGASVDDVKSALLEDSQKSTEITNSPERAAVENPLIAMARKIRDGGKKNGCNH